MNILSENRVEDKAGGGSANDDLSDHEGLQKRGAYEYY